MSINNNIKIPSDTSIINICIIVSLLLIVTLVYLKYKKIELFYNNNTIIPTNVSLVDKALQMIKYKKQYLIKMAEQEQKIQNISNRISNLINK